MVLDLIPQPLPVHFFGSRPQPPTSPCHVGGREIELQHSALQRTATRCDTLQRSTTNMGQVQHTATHCNTLQHTATQHTATHCNTHGTSVLTMLEKKDIELQHAATRCNTLQHTATHCNIHGTGVLTTLEEEEIRLQTAGQVLQCVAVCCSVV